MKPHILILLFFSLTLIIQVISILELKKHNFSSEKLPKITQKINLILLAIGTLMLSTAIVYDINYLRYKQPMPYSEWKKIEWSDFRAIKRPKQTLHGNQNFAFICSEITFEFIGDMLEVSSLFHPARSYTFSEEVAGKNLLKHELYHFHVTEYWSRLIRKEVSLLKDKSDKSGVIELIEKLKRKERKMQYKYDDETYHGYVLGKQRAWQHNVDSCLLSLEPYSNLIINLSNRKP